MRPDKKKSSKEWQENFVKIMFQEHLVLNQTYNES